MRPSAITISWNAIPSSRYYEELGAWFGPIRALAFTLSRKSPSHTGVLSEDDYRRIFEQSSGIYGTTLDYAHRTHEELRRHNIRDRALERLLKLLQR